MRASFEYTLPKITESNSVHFVILGVSADGIAMCRGMACSFSIVSQLQNIFAKVVKWNMGTESDESNKNTNNKHKIHRKGNFSMRRAVALCVDCVDAMRIIHGIGSRFIPVESSGKSLFHIRGAELSNRTECHANLTIRRILHWFFTSFITQTAKQLFLTPFLARSFSLSLPHSHFPKNHTNLNDGIFAHAIPY